MSETEYPPHPDAVDAPGQGDDPDGEYVDEETDAPEPVRVNALAPPDSPFVGVDPQYQNYADETGAPFAAEGEGPEAVLEAHIAEVQETVQTAGEPNVTGYTSVEREGGPLGGGDVFKSATSKPDPAPAQPSSESDDDA